MVRYSPKATNSASARRLPARAAVRGREAACQNQIGHGLHAPRMHFDRRRYVVVSRPGACHPEGLERRYAMSQAPAIDVLEQ